MYLCAIDEMIRSRSNLLSRPVIQAIQAMNRMHGDVSGERGVDFAMANCGGKAIKSTHMHAIEIAAEQLRRGNVIALPTDTLYGLACDANDSKAIQRLYEIKQRDEEKPVAVCVPNIAQLKHYSLAGHLPDGLLTRLLPGAVTIILFKSKHLNNPLLNNGIPKIGVRIPDDHFIRKVSATFNAPIALTSANRSGATSTLSVDEFSDLWSELSAVFDGGHLGDATNDMQQRCGSTVIDLSEPGYYRIVRDGSAKEHTIDVMKLFDVQDAS